MSFRSMEWEKRSPKRLSTRVVKRERASEATASRMSKATSSQNLVRSIVSWRMTWTTMLMMSFEIHKVEIGIKAETRRRKRVEKARKGLVSQTILRRDRKLRRADSRTFQDSGGPSGAGAGGLDMAVIVGTPVAPKPRGQVRKECGL